MKLNSSSHGRLWNPGTNLDGSQFEKKMTSWRCLTCWPVKLRRCKMMSLVNKSGDWTPNYHKILIFFPTKNFEKSPCSQNRWNIREWKNSTCWLVLVVLKIMVFSPFKLKFQIPYYYPLNQWLLWATTGNQGQTVMDIWSSETIRYP